MVGQHVVFYFLFFAVFDVNLLKGPDTRVTCCLLVGSN